MARVIVAPAARDDLDDLIASLRLPRDTRERVKRRLRPLATFPEQGPPLGGRWAGFRFVLGPWSWMLTVYQYDEEAVQVNVATIQDARSERAATASR